LKDKGPKPLTFTAQCIRIRQVATRISLVLMQPADNPMQEG